MAARGRPSKYSQKLAARICTELSDGRSLRSVCGEAGMPTQSMIFRWLREYPAFREQYVIARDEAKFALADELLEIADDARNDYMEDNYDKGRTPGYQLNGENIQRSKLRVDTRKWLLSKMDPRKYGDKIENTGEQKIIVETRRYGSHQD